MMKIQSGKVLPIGDKHIMALSSLHYPSELLQHRFLRQSCSKNDFKNTKMSTQNSSGDTIKGYSRYFSWALFLSPKETLRDSQRSGADCTNWFWDRSTLKPKAL